MSHGTYRKHALGSPHEPPADAVISIDSSPSTPRSVVVVNEYQVKARALARRHSESSSHERVFTGSLGLVRQI